jgi:hypothetical protein
MVARILSNTKNATSTVSSVAEIDQKEERALVNITTPFSLPSLLILPLGMASRSIFPDDWLPRLRLQVPGPNQYCVLTCEPPRNTILTCFRVMPTSREWRQILSSMGMSLITLPLSSSTLPIIASCYSFCP